MQKILTLIALFSGFSGAFLGFLSARRVGSRFSADGVALGYSAEQSSWFWQHCGQIGFALITLAFLLQLIVYFMTQKLHGGRSQQKQ